MTNGEAANELWDIWTSTGEGVLDARLGVVLPFRPGQEREPVRIPGFEADANTVLLHQLARLARPHSSTTLLDRRFQALLRNGRGDPFVADLIRSTGSREVERMYGVMQVKRGSDMTTRGTHNDHVAMSALRLAIAAGVEPRQAILAFVAGRMHDCGHGPLGHSFEIGMEPYVRELTGNPRAHHAHGRHGADTVLAPRGYSPEVQTLVTHHTWSTELPQDRDVVAVLDYIIRWSDRLGYIPSDQRDGLLSGAIQWLDLPDAALEVTGVRDRYDPYASLAVRPGMTEVEMVDVFADRLRTAFEDDIIETMRTKHVVGMSPAMGSLMAGLRELTWELMFERRLEHKALQQDFAALAGALMDGELQRPAVLEAADRTGSHPIAIALDRITALTDNEAFDRAEELGFFGARLLRMNVPVTLPGTGLTDVDHRPGPQHSAEPLPAQDASALDDLCITVTLPWNNERVTMTVRHALWAVHHLERSSVPGGRPRTVEVVSSDSGATRLEVPRSSETNRELSGQVKSALGCLLSNIWYYTHEAPLSTRQADSRFLRLFEGGRPRTAEPWGPRPPSGTREAAAYDLSAVGAFAAFREMETGAATRSGGVSSPPSSGPGLGLQASVPMAAR